MKKPCRTVCGRPGRGSQPGVREAFLNRHFPDEPAGFSIVSEMVGKRRFLQNQTESLGFFMIYFNWAWLANYAFVLSPLTNIWVPISLDTADGRSSSGVARGRPGDMGGDTGASPGHTGGNPTLMGPNNVTGTRDRPMARRVGRDHRRLSGHEPIRQRLFIGCIRAQATGESNVRFGS